MRILLGFGFCLLFAGFVALGFWQLDRAAEKRVLFDAFAAGETQMIGRSLLAEPALPEHRYLRLELHGRYLSSKQVLLDSMTHEGQVGFQVLTPFHPDDSDTWVVVNRGWIANAVDAQALPDVEVDEVARTIVGRIDALPRPGLKLDARAEMFENRWPRPLLFPTLAEIEAELGLPLAQYQLLLDDNQASGFERDWQPRSMPPENHVGYAVQWFSFAAVLIAISAILVIRASRQRKAPQANA